MLDRLSKSSPTAQPLFDCFFLCVTTYNSMQTSPRSSLLALHLSSGRLLISAKSRSPAAGCMLRKKLKSFGVTIDSHLRFDCHVKEVAKACNYHARALRHVRTVLTEDLACSIVGSRLDCCNAMLYGAPAATLDVLQRAQNNLARVVCQRGGRTDARPLLRSLHWLPIKHRVTYKMAALTFKTMSSLTPAYLNDLIQTAVPVRPLRSFDAPLLIVPKRELSSRVGLFRSRLCTLGTHYHPTLDPAVLWTPSNDRQS